jgi:hypothetical protein
MELRSTGTCLNPFFIRSMVRTAGVFFLLSRQWVAEGVDNFLAHEKVFSQNLAGGSRPPAGAAQATGRTALGSSRSHSRQWAWSHPLHIGRRWSGSPLSSTSRSGCGCFPSYQTRCAVAIVSCVSLATTRLGPRALGCEARDMKGVDTGYKSAGR